MFTRLIPDRSAGEGFKYKYHAHQENDALNPRDCAPPPPRPPLRPAASYPLAFERPSPRATRAFCAPAGGPEWRQLCRVTRLRFGLRCCLFRQLNVCPPFRARRV